MAQGVLCNNRASIVLISKTGGGKSSLANALLNTTQFEVSRGMISGTMYCKCISTHARGRDLTVVDTPGTMDVTDEERAKAEIQRAISFCPDGFDIFLVVVKCDSRFTPEERRAIEIAAEMFGEQFYPHAIVVFSHGDEYDNNEAEFNNDLMRFRQRIPYLDELLKKCGNRYALVDNSRRCDKAVQDRQVETLLTQVDALMSLNSNMKYTRAQLEAEQRAREQEKKRTEEEARRKLEEVQLSRERAKREEKDKGKTAMLEALTEAMKVVGHVTQAALASESMSRADSSRITVSVSGKNYCSGPLNGPPCECCDGRCGPDNGCNCVDCMRRDLRAFGVSWSDRALVNKEGAVSRVSKETGRFYCGRNNMRHDWTTDGFCGPDNGNNCPACRQLDSQSRGRYAGISSRWL